MSVSFSFFLPPLFHCFLPSSSSMASPNPGAQNPLPNPIRDYLHRLPRLVLLDYIKSPPRFLLHFLFEGILFYLQLQAGKEGKNQLWFKVGLLVATITYVLICAVPTVIACIWRKQGNQSISQLCCGFWLPYYYKTRPQAQPQPQPQQLQQLQPQLTEVHQAHVHLNIQNVTLANAQAAQVEAMLAQIEAQNALLGSLVGLQVQNIP